MNMNADIGMQEQCQLMDIYKRLRVYVMMRLTKSCLLIPGLAILLHFFRQKPALEMYITQKERPR